ncbi:hypothetical protein MCEMZLE2_00142 [Candidatus Nanopelagicaceae bacterium]
MRKIGSLSTLVVLIFALSPVAPADALFGMTKCEKTRPQITKLENRVNQKIRSLHNVGSIVPISSPIIISIYSNRDSLETSLLQIRKIGLANTGCYNAHQLARLQVSDYWKQDYYVSIFPTDENVIISPRYEYIGLYSKTFR